MICGRWRPSKGGVCCKRPKIGRDACRDCGGNSPRGLEHPSTKTGAYSKELPLRWGRREGGMRTQQLIEQGRSRVVATNDADPLIRPRPGREHHPTFPVCTAQEFFEEGSPPAASHFREVRVSRRVGSYHVIP